MSNETQTWKLLSRDEEPKIQETKHQETVCPPIVNPDCPEFVLLHKYFFKDTPTDEIPGKVWCYIRSKELGVGYLDYTKILTDCLAMREEIDKLKKTVEQLSRFVHRLPE